MGKGLVGEGQDRECPSHLTVAFLPPPGLDRHRGHSCMGRCPAREQTGTLQSGPGGPGVEAEAPPRPQGEEAEAPGKVTGPSSCQSIKG